MNTQRRRDHCVLNLPVSPQRLWFCCSVWIRNERCKIYAKPPHRNPRKAAEASAVKGEGGKGWRIGAQGCVFKEEEDDTQMLHKAAMSGRAKVFT